MALKISHIAAPHFRRFLTRLAAGPTVIEPAQFITARVCNSTGLININVEGWHFSQGSSNRSGEPHSLFFEARLC